MSGSILKGTIANFAVGDIIQLSIDYMSFMTKEQTIGQKIRAWRAKKELTQDELAKKADIPYPTLIKIESDTVTNPTLETVKKIAAGLGVTLDELTQ